MFGIENHLFFHQGKTNDFITLKEEARQLFCCFGQFEKIVGIKLHN
jgi:hypothetical protein